MQSPDMTAALAAAARGINGKASLDDTLLAIARTARTSVPGIDHVGISTLERGGRIHTRAHTDSTVQVLDDLQYGLNEGPCVDALSEQVVVSVPDIRNDHRWPLYVDAAVRATPLKSQLAIQLFLDDKNTLGTLNLYSTSQKVVDPDAIGIADLFAAHAAVALGSARKLSTLHDALDSRKVIGQALGILMERYDMNEDRAFAFLRRASSHGNIKLRDVARELVDERNRRSTPT